MCETIRITREVSYLDRGGRGEGFHKRSKIENIDMERKRGNDNRKIEWGESQREQGKGGKTEGKPMGFKNV